MVSAASMIWEGCVYVLFWCNWWRGLDVSFLYSALSYTGRRSERWP